LRESLACEFSLVFRCYQVTIGVEPSDHATIRSLDGECVRVRLETQYEQGPASLRVDES